MFHHPAIDVYIVSKLRSSRESNIHHSKFGGFNNMMWMAGYTLVACIAWKFVLSVITSFVGHSSLPNSHYCSTLYLHSLYSIYPCKCIMSTSKRKRHKLIYDYVELICYSRLYQALSMIPPIGICTCHNLQ